MLIIVDALYTSVIVAAHLFFGWVTYVHWLIHASIKITPGKTISLCKIKES